MWPNRLWNSMVVDSRWGVSGIAKTVELLGYIVGCNPLTVRWMNQKTSSPRLQRGRLPWEDPLWGWRVARVARAINSSSLHHSETSIVMNKL